MRQNARADHDAGAQYRSALCPQWYRAKQLASGGDRVLSTTLDWNYALSGGTARHAGLGTSLLCANGASLTSQVLTDAAWELPYFLPKIAVRKNYGQFLPALAGLLFALYAVKDQVSSSYWGRYVALKLGALGRLNRIVIGS